MLAEVDLEGLRVRYEAVRPQLQLLVDHVVDRLESQIGYRGISPAAVEGRVKGTSSFVKKAMRKGYAAPWSDIRDKAAVRVTTTSSDDVPVVEDVIRHEFEVLHYEDKRTSLEPNRFGYLGVHFEVGVAVQVDLEESERICEIQIRTGAESAWANVAHDLMYKAPAEPSSQLQRSLYRLVALVELFDGEVLRTKKAIMEEPGYRLGRLLAELENEFLRLTARRSDPELSRIVAESLDPLLPAGGWTEYQPILASFISQYEDKLRRIYDDYLADDRTPLVSQPESLLIFERLENDRFHLAERWSDSLPESLLESMGEIWGIPVHADGD
jgi:ppGpp synthetase/RelA/SpoT-type nucleotidyltranferase